MTTHHARTAARRLAIATCTPLAAEGTDRTRVSRNLNYPAKGMIGLRVRVNTENPIIREHDGTSQGSPPGGEFYDTFLTQVFGGVANFRNWILFYHLPGVEIIVQNALGDVPQRREYA